jgi:hypothetical protein
MVKMLDVPDVIKDDTGTVVAPDVRFRDAVIYVLREAGRPSARPGGRSMVASASVQPSTNWDRPRGPPANNSRQSWCRPACTHMVGEGKSEEEVVHRLVEGLLGAGWADELGFTDLGGSGSASRLSTMGDRLAWTRRRRRRSAAGCVRRCWTCCRWRRRWRGRRAHRPPRCPPRPGSRPHAACGPGPRWRCPAAQWPGSP